MRVPSLVLTVLLALPVVALAQTMEPMTSGLVPVVVREPGVQGSDWHTSLYVRQTDGSSPAQVSLTILNPSGADWSSTVDLPAATGAATVADVVTEVSSAIPDGKYILSWWSTQPVVISTRTYTVESAGSYGQGITAVAPGAGFGQDGQVAFPAPMDFAGHRVNVGIANSGSASQTFTVAALDENGAVVNSWTRTVPAKSIDQFRTNDGMGGVGSIDVRCSEGCDGTAFAYASVVVNDSNDAYFLYAAAPAGATTVAPVATVRDNRGVWFITGGTLYDVYEAMGYAVATDRLWQAELYRRQARGRLADVFGSSYVDSDVFLRTVGYSDQELSDAFAALDAEGKTVIQAYVDGFNRRIAEVRTNALLLPFEFQAVGLTMGFTFLPEPWTTSDVLAWAAMLQRLFDPEGLNLDGPPTGQLDNATLIQALETAYPSEALAMFSDLRWTNDPAAQTMIPSTKAAPRAPQTVGPAGRLPDLRAASSNLRQRFARLRADLERLSARVKMGSYAWVVAGSRTASGDPILYSGPQMGFTAPAIVLEGSIRGGGLNVSGMTVAGIPGIIIGRTRHHAWSMQVGHAHTADFYLEAPASVTLNRTETIHVRNAADVTLPVFRSAHGPILEPIPYDPANPPAAIVAWKSAHWGYEFKITKFALGVARAASVDRFGAALEHLAVSQHFCYADRDGNIAYWMSGRDPIRPTGVDVRFPLPGDGTAEWDPSVLKPRSHDENTTQGFYGGWNNKSNVNYDNAPNNLDYSFGPAHRAHVVKEYLATHDALTYEQVRDLALNIATTDSFAGGGNPWEFVADTFRAAVVANPTSDRTAAVALLDAWDGHFVDGGESQWVAGTLRADAWVLQDRWIREVIRLTFQDELVGAGLSFADQPTGTLFNVLLHALAGNASSIVNQYDWFRDRSGTGLPTTADGIIVQALDTVLGQLGPRPWNQDRGLIDHVHLLIGTVATTPYASRSTYAQCVEMSSSGPSRIESMFPLGEDGTIFMGSFGTPVFSDGFFSMRDVYDAFAPRSFPLFQ